MPFIWCGCRVNLNSLSVPFWTCCHHHTFHFLIFTVQFSFLRCFITSVFLIVHFVDISVYRLIHLNGVTVFCDTWPFAKPSGCSTDCDYVVTTCNRRVISCLLLFSGVWGDVWSPGRTCPPLFRATTPQNQSLESHQQLRPALGSLYRSVQMCTWFITFLRSPSCPGNGVKIG